MRRAVLLTEFIEDGVDVSRQVVHPPVQVFFERGKARLGPLDSGLGGSGGADADFGEALGLITQLTRGFLVQTAKRRPLVFDQALEILEAPGRVVLEAGGDVIPIAELGFKLPDGQRVPFAGRGPLFQDVRALFDEIEQMLLDGLRGLSDCPSSLDRRGEAIEVRLEIGQAYFKTPSVRKHVSWSLDSSTSARRMIISFQLDPRSFTTRLDLVLGR